MIPGRILFGLATACMAAVQPGDGAKRFQVEVPAAVESRQTHLLLRDVVVPRNRAVVLRAYALGADSAKIFLGTTAIPGISREATGTSTTALLRINVTTGLRRWLATSRSARKVDVEISDAGSGDSTAPRSTWSVRAVELVHP